MVFLFVGATSGYKILFISPLIGQNHWLFSQNVISALLKRHHEVTCLTTLTWPDPKPINYTEILAYPLMDLSEFLTEDSSFDEHSESTVTNILLLTKAGQIMADRFLSNLNVQRFLLRTDLTFDLVINEEFFMESLSYFAVKFNAPLVTISKYLKLVTVINFIIYYGKLIYLHLFCL